MASTQAEAAMIKQIGGGCLPENVPAAWVEVEPEQLYDGVWA